MVTLTIDDKTFAAIQKQAAARGLTVAEWLKFESRLTGTTPRVEIPIGQQMAAIFAEIGLADSELFPEFKGQSVRMPELD